MVFWGEYIFFRKIFGPFYQQFTYTLIYRCIICSFTGFHGEQSISSTLPYLFPPHMPLNSSIMAETLRPFVYWGQKNDHVSLKVDLRNVSVSKKESTCVFFSLTTPEIQNKNF